MAKFNSIIEEIIDELNVKAEDIKENFESFREVALKEMDIQSKSLKDYSDRLQSTIDSNLKVEDFVEDFKEEVEYIVKDLRSHVDRFYNQIKESIEQIK